MTADEWSRDQPDETWAKPLASSELVPGITYEVWADGLLLFDFAESAPIGAWSDEIDHSDLLTERAALCNAYMACLDSVQSQRRFALGRRAVLVSAVVREYKHGPSTSHFASHDRVVSALLAIPGREVSAWALGIEPVLKAGWVPNRQVVTLDAVAKSMQLLAQVVQAGQSAVVLCELLLKGSSAIELENYTEALIYCWTATERAVGVMVDEAVRQVASALNGIMPQGVGRWSAFRCIEFLALHGWLDSETLADLAAVRKARNAWLHDLDPVSRDTAYLSLDVACALVSHIFNIRLMLRPLDESGRV